MLHPERFFVPTPDRVAANRLAARMASMGLMVLTALAASAAEPGVPAFRYHAPLVVSRPGSFVQVPMSAAVYAHSLQPGLADLRVLDVRGERVPHAWLPAAQPPTEQQQRNAPLYALPLRAAPDGALGLPIEVSVRGNHIRVRRSGGPAPERAGTPGWLFDLGEHKAGEPAAHTLRLQWTATADFSAAYELDTSSSLREWRRTGGGQLLSLAGAGGPLVQRDVPLPADSPRFVRLVWRDAATAPRLAGAQVLSEVPGTPQDPPTVLRVKPGTEPASAVTPPAPALHFDLGGALPISTLQLQLPPGTRVLPVRVQGRSHTTAPWQELGATVFYRLQRDGQDSVSPAWPLQATLRYLRLLPDERSAAPEAAATQLVVRAWLPSLVFAAQGTPPYTLQAGVAPAPSLALPGALPLATLVPQWSEERLRWGLAEVGAFAEQAEVAQRAEAERRQAALRPWLLWAVLLAGVAGLGFMVWKLARAGKPPAP